MGRDTATNKHTEIRYFGEDGNIKITKNHLEEWKLRDTRDTGRPPTLTIYT